MLYEICRAAALALAFTGIVIASGCHPDFAADVADVAKPPVHSVALGVESRAEYPSLRAPFDDTVIGPTEAVGAAPHE